MKVGQLKSLLTGIPDDAEVYIEADHGQNPEKAGCVDVCTENGNLPYYGDELKWEDKDDVVIKNITAVVVRY